MTWLVAHDVLGRVMAAMETVDGYMDMEIAGELLETQLPVSQMCWEDGRVTDGYSQVIGTWSIRSSMERLRW